MTRQVWTVDEFCQAHAISRATFYNLRKRGAGPRVMKVGARTLVSSAAAAEWRERMENAAGSNVTDLFSNRSPAVVPDKAPTISRVDQLIERAIASTNGCRHGQ
jgi:predicted DNA-binding transcriptional regulator AlpA